MAKLSAGKKASANRSEHRKLLVKKYATRYAKLKAIADDETLSEAERQSARLKMAGIPRTASSLRFANVMRLPKATQTKATTLRPYYRPIQPVTKEDKISSSDARSAVLRYLAGRTD